MIPNLRKIVVVFKSHFDFGFTGLPQEVLQSYANEMIPRALDVWEQTRHLGRDKGFVWTLPAWVLHTSLEMLDGRPDGKRLIRAVEERGVVWHALPFTTHSELLSPEVLIRGLWYGRDLSERFGHACISAKMTDVPGHTSFIPSLLAGAGIRFLHLGSNSCSTPPNVPELFRWEGPDGGSVITMYSKGGYGSGLLPDDRWKLPVWLALQHTMDNEGPQNSSLVRGILDVVSGAHPEIEVVTGGLDDFARSLMDYGEELPVIRGDLADTWIHGIASMPVETAKARSTMHLLPAAEYILSCTENTSAVERSYAQLLLYGEHTFGLDTKIALNPKEQGGRVYRKEDFLTMLEGGGYRRILESWEAKADYASSAEAVLNEALCGARGGRQSGLRVFNAQPWEYRGPIELTPVIQGDGVPIEARASFADGTSAVFPCLKRDGRWYFLASGLPPLAETEIELSLGARGISVEESWEIVPQGERSVTIGNEFLEITVDAETGEISSLIDRQRRREWVAAQEGRFSEYRYDLYGKEDILSYLKSYAYDLTDWYLADFGKPDYPRIPHKRFEGNLTELSVRRDPGIQEIRCRFQPKPEAHTEYGDAAETTIRITLYDDLAWTEISYALREKSPTQFLESGHAVFPLRSANPVYSMKRTGGVIDPTTDVPENANRGLLCCDDWVDVSDEHGGLLFIPFDSPLVSIGEPAISRFDGDYRPKKPLLYFNLYNNQWGTNFPQWIQGDLDFRFRLAPHSGNWQDAHAYRVAGDALRPPILHFGEPAPISILPAGMSGLEILSLRFLGKEQTDRSSIVVRLREAAGRSGTHDLAFPSTDCELFLLDLMERSPRQVELSREHARSSARIHFSPFEIKTLRIELRDV